MSANYFSNNCVEEEDKSKGFGVCSTYDSDKGDLPIHIAIVMMSGLLPLRYMLI